MTMGNDIDIVTYFNEKFNDLKAQIMELKTDIKGNQSDINSKIKAIEDELIEYRIILKYKKPLLIYAVGSAIVIIALAYTAIKPFIQ